MSLTVDVNKCFGHVSCSICSALSVNSFASFRLYLYWFVDFVVLFILTVQLQNSPCSFTGRVHDAEVMDVFVPAGSCRGDGGAWSETGTSCSEQASEAWRRRRSFRWVEADGSLKTVLSLNRLSSCVLSVSEPPGPVCETEDVSPPARVHLYAAAAGPLHRYHPDVPLCAQSSGLSFISC